jgi:repressor LexA
MVALTEAQRKVVEYIFVHVRDTGMPPTLREICAQLGWNAVGSAQDVVAALRKKGYLLPPDKGKSRQIVLSPWVLEQLQKSGDLEMSGVESAPYIRTPPAPLQSGVLWVPLLGMVQAGLPNEAIEHMASQVPFHFPLGRKSQDHFFALVVEGYSMLNAGFLPGDQLLVERASTARDGDIVVAAPAPGEATVKRFAARGSQLFQKAVESLSGLTDIPPALLLPENPVFEPIPFGDRDDARILGLVRSLVRPVI